MAIDTANVKAVVFDYGNTVIEFGPRQVMAEREAFTEFLSDLIGPPDARHLKAIRDRQIVAPYSNQYRENDMVQISVELVEDLYGRSPTDDEVNSILEERHRLFLNVVVLPEGVRPMLQSLRERFRLAMISNYPSGRAIRDSLVKIGIHDLFEKVVVSGDVGFVKPHPRPFDHAREKLGLRSDECLYVGDNWLADVQGAKRAGWQVVHTTQYVPYEQFDPEPGDAVPDASIEHFSELESILL